MSIMQGGVRGGDGAVGEVRAHQRLHRAGRGAVQRLQDGQEAALPVSGKSNEVVVIVGAYLCQEIT